MKPVMLQEIVGGAIQEQFAKAFEKVIGNLADPNTSFKDARKITITMKFTQNEARDDVHCDVAVSEKLAPQAPIKTAFAVGKDLKTGDLYAEEYGKNIKGQVSFDEMNVDHETGELLEPQPKKVADVIDLRKANF